MMTLKLLVRIIPALWFSACALAAPVASPDLADLVKSWRSAPTDSRREEIEAYAASHAQDGSLARLALGIGAYEQKDFSAAIENLKKIQGKLPGVEDYVAYYLAASRAEANEFDSVAKDAAPVHVTAVRSPVLGKTWVVEARALEQSSPEQAVRLLRDHYADLPQPDGDLTLGEAYQAAKDLKGAAEFYQRVYYQYIAGDPADRSAAALSALKETMGADYPEPLPAQVLRRADRLMETGDYTRARQEYEAAVDKLVGLPQDQARVRIGAADGLAGNPSAAASYLRTLELSPSAADAERWYYLEEFTRRMGDDTAMAAAVKQLGEQYPKSPWRAKALVSAANRFLVTNRPDDYLPLYRAVYEDFPNDGSAAVSHWKVAFEAYFHGRADAAGLLREHLKKYPRHTTAGAALYFLGRSFENAQDIGGARACYDSLVRRLQNTYYGIQARDRLAVPPLAGATPAPEIEKFLAGLDLSSSKPVPTLGSRNTAVRIDRSRLLRRAGLNDLADTELRFGARVDGEAPLLAMEIAANAAAPHMGMRVMKLLSPDYLGLSVDQAPRKYWELLFPLPYRTDLMSAAKRADVDPYLVAGLIRQESEFNPQAVSRAAAYGLTQVRPGTGRQFARRAGVVRFSTGILLQPAPNLKIGASIFRSMLDEHSGHLEETLASYNAGPRRAAEWLSWNTYREPAEFVESIPFTETRDYVQAVLRNADMYRRLYQ
jgi:soluble lytic murein transglycosylase